LSKIETIELNNEEIRDNLIAGYENWKEDC